MDLVITLSMHIQVQSTLTLYGLQRDRQLLLLALAVNTGLAALPAVALLPSLRAQV